MLEPLGYNKAWRDGPELHDLAPRDLYVLSVTPYFGNTLLTPHSRMRKDNLAVKPSTVPSLTLIGSAKSMRTVLPSSTTLWATDGTAR